MLKMISLVYFFVLPIVSIAFLTGTARAQVPSGAGDWPQWRGPERNGISSETGLLKEWPKDGPRLLWKAKKAGGGYSAVSISKGRLFTQGDREDGSYLIAYDRASGEELWAAKNGPIYPNTRGGGPRGTPTVDGDLVYALSGAGSLICAEAASGKERWKLDIFAEFDGKNPHWGIGESPLIEKGLAIVTPGGKDAALVALDKVTGKTVWKTASEKDGAAYSSAIACDAAGVRQVIAVTSKSVIGARALDGKLLWRYTGSPKGSALNGVANIPTPVVRGEHVFISTDYGAGAVLLKLEKDGDGVKATEVYFTKEMQNHHATSLLVGDNLYGISGNSPTRFVCMEFATGKVLWSKEGLQKSGIVYADGHIYCLGEEGEAALVEASPGDLLVKSRFHAFDEKPDPKQTHRKKRNTWSHPVVAGGRLYLRNQDEIFCYEIAAAEKTAGKP